MSERERSKRPSGLGSNSKKFATVTRPDGSKIKVPAPRDAVTVLYMAEENGAWPKSPFVSLLVDLPWLADGSAVELEWMIPGKGMGRVMAVSVISVLTRIRILPGKYGQVVRMVLVTPVLRDDEKSSAFARQFLGGGEP